MEAVLFEEQTKDLYAKGPSALLASLATSALLVVALWPLVSHRLALGWILLMYASIAGRLALVRAFRAAPAGTSDPSRWHSRWVAGTLLAGVIWGLGGFLLYPARSTSGQDLALFVIGGMVAGASSSLGSRLVTFLAFAIPALAGPIVRLFLEGDRLHASMAALLIVFAIGMTSVTYQAAHTLAEAVRLRFKNARLAQDLTVSQRDLERRVAERTKELQETIRQRDGFVSVVSHELRTPLSSLGLTQELLKRNARQTHPNPQRTQRDLAIMSRQIARMRHLLNDLLDLSRLSTEQMRYNMEPLDLRAVIDESLDEMDPQFRLENASVDVQVADGLRGHFDRYRMEQVVVNLLSNALKYGAMPFSLSAHKTDDWARIVVHDSGPGIPAEQLGRIFDAFQRGPSSTGSGLGLGLFIAERIVTAHHGTIRAESAPGQGTSFVVDLPLDDGASTRWNVPAAP